MCLDLELPEGGLTRETFHGTVGVPGRGELCPRGRGWTPRALAEALRHIGVNASHQTLWRACRRGEIPHTATAGGHVRIDPGYVARTWPALGHSPV
jgi:hypothetical protein